MKCKTKEQLIAFEDKCFKSFEEGDIKAPIHLSGDNEQELIDLFDEEFKASDWIFSTWRNHYHWLLSGRSENKLAMQILDGNSMAVVDNRFFTSAIVGGIAPIALGVALGIKLKEERATYKTQSSKSTSSESIPLPTVWCFLGDMGAECGISKESIRYAEGHNLPIEFVIEDNRLSVTTDTQKVWGDEHVPKTRRYRYKRKFPHAGIGKRVLF